MLDFVYAWQLTIAANDSTALAHLSQTHGLWGKKKKKAAVLLPAERGYDVHVVVDGVSSQRPLDRAVALHVRLSLLHDVVHPESCAACAPQPLPGCGEVRLGGLAQPLRSFVAPRHSCLQALESCQA